MRIQVRDEAIDAVRDRRVDRAAGLVARAEHEVVDDQLTSAIEKLGKRARAVVGVEPVVLLDGDPWQLASLARQLVAQPRVLLLADEQLLARGCPLLARSDPVVCDGCPWSASHSGGRVQSLGTSVVMTVPFPCSFASAGPPRRR